MALSKTWACQQSSYRKTTHSARNSHCGARIHITIEDKERTKKNLDEFLCLPVPLPAEIRIDLKHSHHIENADSLRMLRVSDELSMEVLDNGSHMKDPENQATGGNFSCRLPRDINIGNSTVSRNKGEADVRLLIACKAQLSSEVVRLKTESLRLQKERDSARMRMKELEQIIGKFSERTRELENRLYAAEEENKRLKGRMLGMSNASALQKLSLNFDKFHSYPWTENQTNPLVSENSCLNTVEIKRNSPPQEDWKEVSQKLLEQMKQEMKELQQMSSSFSLQENNSDVITTEVGRQSCDSKVCDDTLEESLSSLMTETESLKHSLLHQRRTLKLLMQDFIQGSVHHSSRELTKDQSKACKTFESNLDPSTSSVKPKSFVNQSSKHSDDSFRAFFTKHLEGCQNIDKMTKTMQLFMQQTDDSAADLSKSALKFSSSKSSRSQTEDVKNSSDKGISEEERVCPICQVSFDASIPQKQFEEHVVNHLEVESASLLDQYVVI